MEIVKGNPVSARAALLKWHLSGGDDHRRPTKIDETGKCFRL
jgi:hypothetical protein